MTKRLSSVVAGDLIDWTAAGLFIKGNPASNGGIEYWGDGANRDFKMSYLSSSRFSLTGDGTVNHNCTQFGAAAAPGNFLFNSYSGVPSGAQTMGFGTITTTQVTVKTGGGVIWTARGIKN